MVRNGRLLHDRLGPETPFQMDTQKESLPCGSGEVRGNPRDAYRAGRGGKGRRVHRAGPEAAGRGAHHPAACPVSEAAPKMRPE